MRYQCAAPRLACEIGVDLLGLKANTLATQAFVEKECVCGFERAVAADVDIGAIAPLQSVTEEVMEDVPILPALRKEKASPCSIARHTGIWFHV